jgi:hypothetical protein
MARSCNVVFSPIIPQRFIEIFMAVHPVRLDYVNDVTRGDSMRSASPLPVAVNFMCDFRA